MIKWAGRILVVLATFHLVTTAFAARGHLDAWLGGDLWFSPGAPERLGQDAGSFWLTAGSFGVPLLLLGLTIVWLDRRRIVPPAFIAWTLAAWLVLCGLVWQPGGFFLGLVPVGMLLVGARKAASRALGETA